MTLHRYVFKIEVLSDEEIGSVDLSWLHYLITEGHCSGHFLETEHKTVSKEEMCELLEGQGSDPSFLCGDEE